MQPNIRASDAERQHVVDILQDQTSTGRLTLDEFETRVDAAQRAVTRADLAALTADLPQPTTPPARRPLVIGLVVAAIVLVLLIVTAILAGLAGWGHMGPMMGGCCR
jgi:hypothetical protein